VVVEKAFIYDTRFKHSVDVSASYNGGFECFLIVCSFFKNEQFDSSMKIKA